MKYFDRVKETSTTTGTGNFTLAGAATGFRTFASVLSTNDTCYYCIALQGGSEWEVGLGTYSATNTLTRTTVLSSSNSGNAVNFSAGTKDVLLTVAANRFKTIDLTGTSSDYLLQPGEKARIDFSSATSIPLHIASDPTTGYYKITIIGDRSASASSSVLSLVPNAGGLTAGSVDNLQIYISALDASGSTGVTPSGAKVETNVFKLADNAFVLVEAKVSTKTLAKSVISIATMVPEANYTQANYITGIWADNSTEWTSLGAISCGVAHSGTILVERII